MSSVIEVLRTGLASIQDAGRLGFEHLGVARAGFADAQSAAIANALLGNRVDAACIEVQQSALSIRFLRNCFFAWSGSPARLALNERNCLTHIAKRAVTGDVLECSPNQIARYGYLAIMGGFNTEVVLGSQSSDSNARWGTFLSAGMNLSAHRSDSPAIARSGVFAIYETKVIIRILTNNLALANQLCQRAWRISAQSNRMGYRLNGEPLERVPNSLPSSAVCPGLIQVPPDGAPIVIGPDGGTTGGYPVAGCVIQADYRKLMQATGEIRFVSCTLQQALLANRLALAAHQALLSQIQA